MGHLINHLYRRGSVCLTCNTLLRNISIMAQTEAFHFQKALILSKFSRYEFEKIRHPECTEKELIEKLKRRGSDYKNLIHHHDIHCQSRDNLNKCLKKRGIETRIVNRLQFNQQNIDWSDVIFTTGGDGTFLMASSRVNCPDKPVIGINSDPSRSVGYLCLPQPYSSDLEMTINKLCAGKFKWSYRQRIRVTLIGENAIDPPIELHNQQMMYPEYRYLDLDEKWLKSEMKSITNEKYEVPRVTLPVRALNEVFVGESLSSRVSYYELTVDNQPRVKMKSSGLTVCTGTGSTSWSYNINRLTTQCAKAVFKISESETGIASPTDEQISKITKKFNDSLIFNPSQALMAYTIRDPIMLSCEISDTRGFCNKIEVKSRMFDACVVIDGGLSYKFNDGAVAKFEILEEDRLKTILSI